MKSDSSFKILLTLIISLILIITVLAISCSIYNPNLVEEVKKNGDLGRIGWIPIDSPKTPAKNITIQRINWIKYFENPEKYDIDLLIVGDSFSDVGNLPDYLATYNDMQVLAVRQHAINGNKTFTPFNLLIAMDNGGIIDKINPKIILLEQVEREEYDRTNEINFNSNISMDEFETAIRKSENKLSTINNPIMEMDKNTDSHEIIDDINMFQYFVPPSSQLRQNDPINEKIKKTINFSSESFNTVKYISLSQIWLILTGHSYNQISDFLKYSTYKLKLSEPLFTSPKDNNTLYFLSDDLLYLNYIDDTIWINHLNSHLNTLSNRFAKKNISFYYLSAPDKFDFYFSCIEDNTYPKNPYYEQMDGLCHSYHYINAKEILNKRLSDKERDIYWLGDTHWSWMSTEYLSSQISPINYSIHVSD